MVRSGASNRSPEKLTPKQPLVLGMTDGVLADGVLADGVLADGVLAVFCIPAVPQGVAEVTPGLSTTSAMQIGPI